MRLLLAYLLAVIATYLLAATAATQHVAGQLARMNAPLDLSQRLSMTAQDWLGMAPSLLPLIAVGLLIAFLVAGALTRRLPTVRVGLFVAAGLVALITLHLAMEISFGLNPIATTRYWPGLLLQGVCGACGGWLFIRIWRPGSSPA